jgi:small subunit ribosomal protein S16
MAVVIRLKTMGTKKKIKHRFVVTDQRFPRNGRFLEEVGYWDPSKSPMVLNVKTDRVAAWIEKGAVPSDTVRSLLKKAGMNMTKAVKTHPNAKPKKAVKKGPAMTPKAGKKA